MLHRLRGVYQADRPAIYVYVFRFFVSASLTMLLSFLAYIVVAFVYKVECHWGMFWPYQVCFC